MRQLEASSGKECVSARGAWPISVAAAAAAMVLAVLLVPMYFPTNDDPYAIQVLSGGGGVAAEPTPYVPFINIVPCWAVSSLYRVLPTVPWWVVFHLVAIGISLLVVGRAALLVARSRLRAVPRALELTLLAVLDFGLGCYFVARLQFTSTASLLMAAAVFASCCRPLRRTDWAGGIGPRVVLPVCLASTGFALREQSGLLGLFFWALAVVALLARGEGSLRERFLVARDAVGALALVGVVAVVLLIVQKVAYVPMSLSTANDMGSAMSGYTDYPRTPYAEDPARYEEFGWDEELAQLVGDYWFMMDERVNTEALESINAQNTQPIDELLEHPKTTILNRLHYVVQPVPMTYFALLFGVAVAALVLSPTRGERLVTWAIVGAVLVLLGYLLVRGRLLERAAYAVTLPATAALLTIAMRNLCASCPKGRSLLSPALATLLGIATLALLWLRAGTIGGIAALLGAVFCVALLVRQALVLHGLPNERLTLLTTVGAVMIACSLALAPGVVTVKKYGVGSWEARDQERLVANTNALFSYVSKHPDTLYVYSGCPITLQYVWQDKWPVNQTGWGVWRWPYDWFDEAMRAAGFDGRPTSEDFLEGDMLFVSGNDVACDLLLRYMRNTFGEDIQMVQVDEIAGVMGVYQFVREGE